MLYFLTESETVVREYPPNVDYESFTPTFDGSSGWLLFYTYHTYDSFGTDSTKYWEVIDLYEEKEQAVEVAKAIRDSQFGGEFKATKFDGSKIYATWQHWGTSLDEVYVLPVTIKTEASLMKERF